MNEDESILRCVCCGNLGDVPYLNVCMSCYVKYRHYWVEADEDEDLMDLFNRVINLCNEHNKEIEEVDE